jgi:hypothetical protein
VVRRHRHLSWKVLALAGAGLVLLVANVLLLTLLVMPLAASTRRVSTSLSPRAPQSVELALLLPTRDPGTPWPTGTPMPAATPGSNSLATNEAPPAPGESIAQPNNTIAAATPEPVENPPLVRGLTGQATPLQAPVGSTALPQSTVVPATPLPSVKAGAAALVTTPTPTLQAAAMPPIAPDASEEPPTETPEPVETSAVTPSETPSPTATTTPVANRGETPPPPGPPATPGDIPDFEAFLRLSRNTISGQPLELVSLTMDVTTGAIPRFVLEVAGSETNDVFAAQPAAEVLSYGRRFLDDAKRYLGDEQCAIAVESTYVTSNKDACTGAPTWCRLGAYDQAANAWTVNWTYVRGSFTGGPYTMEAWNAAP